MDKEQVVKTTFKYEQKGESPVQVSRTLGDALKNTSRETINWSKQVTGATQTIEVAKNKFQTYIATIKKVGTTTDRLSLIKLRLVNNIKAERGATISLQKAHVNALAMNQKRINNVQKAEVLAHEIAKKLTLRKEKDEVIGRQMHQRFLARQNAKIAKLQKAEAQARAINSKMIASQQKNAQATARFGKVTEQAVQRAILSWKSFERVLLVHVIRRAFHQLLATFRQSITQIQDFHAAVVEIRTISQTLPSTFDQWSKSLQNVSNAFGIDIMDAANSRYQILSNQITKGVVQTEIFSAAVFKFAKVTKSTAEEGVNVLTAAMNAYGMSAEEVTQVSATLFKLVEFGRVRISEIAESLGRASVPAAQLGISLEELSAAVATITIKGVKATESMTLIRGIIMKLNRPTGDMENLFNKLGVSSGEALIGIHGLAGALKILYEETKGSSSEIAELFGRIRPAMGVSALLSDLAGFQKVLSEFGDKALIDYLAAVNDQFKTTGERAKLAFNQVKNLVQIGLGEASSAVIVSVSDKFKTFEENIDGTKREISGLVNIIKVATRAIIALGAAFIGKKLLLALTPSPRTIITWKYLIFNIQMTIAAGNGLTATMLGIRAAVVSLTTALAPMAAFVVAAFAFDAILKWRMEINSTLKTLKDVNDQYEKLRKQREAIADIKEKADTSASGIFKGKLRAGARGLSRGLGAATSIDFIGNFDEKTLTAKMKEITRAQKDMLASFKESAKGVAQTMGDVYSALQDEIKESAKLIKDSLKIEATTAGKLADLVFAMQQESRTPGQQLTAVQGGAKQALREFGTAGSIKGKRDAFKKYTKFLIDAKDIETKAAEDTAKAIATAENVKIAARNKTRSEYMRQRGYSSYQRGLFKEGNLSGDLSLAARGKINAKYIKLIQEAQKKQAKAELDERNRLTDLVTEAEKLQKKLQGFRDKLIELAKGVGKAAGDVVVNAFKDIELGDAKEELAKIVETLKTSGHLGKGFLLPVLDAATEYENINTQVLQTTEGLKAWNTQLSNAKTTMQSIFKLMGQEKTARTNITKAMSDAHAAQLDTAKNIKVAIDALLSTGNPALRGQAMKLSGFTKILVDPKTTAKQAKESLKGVKAVFAEIQAIQARMAEGMSGKQKAVSMLGPIGGYLAVKDALADAKKAIGALEAMKNAFEFAGEAITALEKAEEETKNLDVVISKMASIEAQAIEAGAALHEAAKVGIEDYSTFRAILADVDWYLGDINSILGGTEKDIRSSTQGKVLGGAIHAAMGSMIPRGTDTVPAMLTPGEFVMNQASTQRFMSQLVPMNYGQANTNFTGSDNSVQFGDMHITVNGQGTSKQTAMEIGNELRREIRRGRIAL